MAGPGLNFNVLRVLLGRHDLFKQHAQRRLAIAAAELDVGEYPFQVTDTGRDRLHLANRFEYPLEIFVNRGERGAEPCFKRTLELFVDGDAHFLQFRGVLGAKLIKSTFHTFAQFILTPLVAVCHVLDHC